MATEGLCDNGTTHPSDKAVSQSRHPLSDLFVSVGLASACGMWFSALPERRFFAAVFMAMLWGFWSLLSCWLLLAYWRKELRIVNGQITQRGVIGLKEIDL